MTLLIGIGNALVRARCSAPCSRSSCRREDMAGAISLNSVQMNASRVIGPVIGGFLYADFGAELGVRCSTP